MKLCGNVYHPIVRGRQFRCCIQAHNVINLGSNGPQKSKWVSRWYNSGPILILCRLSLVCQLTRQIFFTPKISSNQRPLSVFSPAPTEEASRTAKYRKQIFKKRLLENGKVEKGREWKEKGKRNESIDRQEGRNLVQLIKGDISTCLLYTSPSPRDRQKSRMPSSA